MITAQNLINQSLRLIGVLAAGESPASSESNDALAALNQLLASWSAQKAPCLGVVRRTLAMDGSASYTIGPGAADLDAARPVKIKAVAWVSNGVPVPYEAVPAEVWRAGPPPRSLFYDAQYPIATFWVSPPPTAGDLELEVLEPLEGVASLATEIDLPPGYERALRYALAMDLAPEYGRVLPQEALAVASEAIGAIAGLNREVLGEAAAATAPPAA